MKKRSARIYGSAHPPGKPAGYDGMILRQDEINRDYKKLIGLPVCMDHTKQVIGKVSNAYVDNEGKLIAVFDMIVDTEANASIFNSIIKGEIHSLSLGLDHIVEILPKTFRVAGRKYEEVSVTNNPGLANTRIFKIEHNINSESEKNLNNNIYKEFPGLYSNSVKGKHLPTFVSIETVASLNTTKMSTSDSPPSNRSTSNHGIPSEYMAKPDPSRFKQDQRDPAPKSGNNPDNREHDPREEKEAANSLNKNQNDEKKQQTEDNAPGESNQPDQEDQKPIESFERSKLIKKCERLAPVAFRFMETINKDLAKEPIDEIKAAIEQYEKFPASAYPWLKVLTRASECLERKSRSITEVEEKYHKLKAEYEAEKIDKQELTRKLLDLKYEPQSTQTQRPKYSNTPAQKKYIDPFPNSMLAVKTVANAGSKRAIDTREPSDFEERWDTSKEPNYAANLLKHTEDTHKKFKNYY